MLNPPAPFSMHAKVLRDAPTSLTHTMKRYASQIALSMTTADGQTLGRGGPRRRPSILSIEAIKV